MELNTPLYNALREYAAKKNTPFHTPGNKAGMAIPKKFKKNVFDLDLTELALTDNLAAPDGCILRAQEEAAKAFGADKTFFITCGSTIGIMAMLAYACGKGGKIIADRNCHTSVINAFALLDIEPVFVYPGYLQDRGITGSINVADVEKALQEHPDVCGAIITSPNYYGICSDLTAISDMLHKNGKLLLVDEAHGAHFAFSPLLPKTAMESGADICVQSAHKTIPALGQAALLHASERIDGAKMQTMLNLFHTSSPSYIIMAYTDLARAIMQEKGEKIYRKQKEYIEELDKALHGTGFEIINKQTENSIFDHDFTRICITVSGAGISGYHAAEQLENRYGIVPEMADLNNVVLIAGAGISKKHYKALGKALAEIASQTNHVGNTVPIIPYPLHASQKAMPLSEAFWSSKRQILLKDAQGAICANVVMCYPPSVPFILPGEVIESAHIEYIEAVIKAGGKVTGLQDGTIGII